MEIGFALNITDDTTKFKPFFDYVEETVQDFVKDKNYGTGLSIIYVGWICVSPKYERFFKLMKPKYYENEERFTDGRRHLLSKLLECEIKLDYDGLINKTNYEIKKIIFSELEAFLIPVIKNNKKIKDFDVDRFSEDLKLIPI